MNPSYLITGISNNASGMAETIGLYLMKTFAARLRTMASVDPIVFLLEVPDSVIMSELAPIPSRISAHLSPPTARRGLSSLLSPPESCSLRDEGANEMQGLDRWTDKVVQQDELCVQDWNIDCGITMLFLNTSQSEEL